MKIFIFLITFLSSGLCFGNKPELRLINGKPADQKEWPSSVYASMSNSRCTATVIGERTLLIAAHCASTGQKASFSVGTTKYSSTCTQSPQYQGNDTADWTLCLIDKVVTEAAYENINVDSSKIKVGQELMLTGFGCIQPGGGGVNDGVYRIGTSKVARVPSGSSNNIVTSGGAALCFGDSGGPAFLVDSSTKERWVVAVNSRGDIQTTSYLPSVASSSAQQFFKDWAQKNSQEICGIHSTAVGCRQSNCTPLPFAYAGPDATIRPGESIYLGDIALPGQSYLWSPSSSLDHANVARPLATPSVTTTYTLRVTTECGSAQKTVTIKVASEEGEEQG